MSFKVIFKTGRAPNAHAYCVEYLYHNWNSCDKNFFPIQISTSDIHYILVLSFAMYAYLIFNSQFLYLMLLALYLPLEVDLD